MANSITSKGQVTIPKAIRDRLGLKPGDKVEFTENAQGEVIVLPSPASRTEATAKPVSEMSYRERLRSVVGAAEPNGMSTDEFMDWLRGET